MNHTFYSLITIFTIILVFSLCFFIPLLAQYGYVSSYIPNNYTITTNINSSEFIWPSPGYTTITSKFGYRNSPTSGAGTYHGGIDIAAPTGSNIIATFSGIVTYTGFKGANGYTITVENGSFSFSCSHVSPNFLVHVGQYINKGEIIANVGPKNVYGVPNNPYKDNNGNPTNGATTGPHLHFSIKKDGKAVNPLDYF